MSRPMADTPKRRARRQFTDEFKASAVRLVLDEGKTVGAAARAALRTLERTPPTAPRRHALPAAVHARLMAHPDWLATLARRTGVVHDLESR